jgi:hypothetical protein
MAPWQRFYANAIAARDPLERQASGTTITFSFALDLVV